MRGLSETITLFMVLVKKFGLYTNLLFCFHSVDCLGGIVHHLQTLFLPGKEEQRSEAGGVSKNVESDP